MRVLVFPVTTEISDGQLLLQKGTILVTLNKFIDTSNKGRHSGERLEYDRQDIPSKRGLRGCLVSKISFHREINSTLKYLIKQPTFFPMSSD